MNTTETVKDFFKLSPNEPFKISRSKIELYCQCPRCFYLDRKLGVSQPAGAPFTLNNAVDALLKKEFDNYRIRGETHPFLKENNVEAVPFAHPEIEAWRKIREGIQYFDASTNFLIFGAIDDVWQGPSGELMIVDYKAKSTDKEISVDPKRKKNGEIVKTDRYLLSYRRQLELYQWLFRKNGFQVSNTGYFVFANAQKGKPAFNDNLSFEKVLVAYEGDTSWIEPTIEKIFQCLQSESLPDSGEDCDFCQYRLKAHQVEKVV